MYGGTERASAGIGAQSVPTASRETHVGGQMSRQGNLVDELSKVLSVLEERLRPVLRNSPALAAGKESQDKMQLVGLAAAVSNQNDQLQNLIHSVQDILDRLEL